MSGTSPQSATGYQQILGYGAGTKLGQYHDITLVDSLQKKVPFGLTPGGHSLAQAKPLPASW